MTTKVLILGSGQLARMMYLAGVPLGIEVAAVDVADESVVNPVTKQMLGITLEQAMAEATAISVEFEHIPEPLLAKVGASGKLFPSVEAILTGADRVREKALLDKLGIANCPHAIVTHVDQLDQAVVDLGEKLIIKASRDGYDGYGQWRLQSVNDLPALKQELSKLDLEKVPLVVETMAIFSRELSLVAARDHQGEVRCYPLAENLHHQGQLHVSISPAPHITAALQHQAEMAFTKLADELGYVGVLAVEFFQVGDELWVNEIAPRVHNSGHWSMQGAVCCQFENHLRAVAGMPLGSTKTTHGVTAMVNVIGCEPDSTKVLAQSQTHLHLYGKSVRQKRKMGHINVTAENYPALGEALSKLADVLPIEFFPELAGEAKRLLG